MAAGVLSTVVGLASVVSYPALLAIGLPPLSANMTNTVSLLFTGVGAAAGSRPELAGQASRIRRLGTIAALGGGAGAALLLITPPQTFVRVAPVLIGAASLALLALPGRTGHPPRREDRTSQRSPEPDDDAPTRAGPRERSRGCWSACSAWRSTSGTSARPAASSARRAHRHGGRAAGPDERGEEHARRVANAVAAVAFAVFGHVDWAAVVPLAARVPGRRLDRPGAGPQDPGAGAARRVAVCGLAVAVKLGSPPTADPVPPAAGRGQLAAPGAASRRERATARRAAGR